jgi:hypothetical protein
MLSHQVTFTTSRAMRAAIAAAIAALAVTGCGFTGPDPAGCKAALQAEYVKVTAGQGHFNPDPPACKGLPKAQVQQFAQQVLEGK